MLKCLNYQMNQQSKQLNQIQRITQFDNLITKKQIFYIQLGDMRALTVAKPLMILLVSFMFFCIIQARIRVINNRFYDSQGAQRIFHGLNLVQKVFPYYTHFNETDMQRFKQWGMNGIRLGVMWPGVEPKQGVFNQTYLQVMKRTVDLAGKYGIYTLVQYHQDLFSEKFCGDGVPFWAIPDSVSQSFPWPLQKRIPFDPQTGFPTGQACKSKYGWGIIYFTRAVNKGFDHLWNNKGGMLQKFGRYWRKVAQTFKDNEYVIGLQLVNEPWPGNVYRDILNMVPRASQFNMAKAYDYIATQIRKTDPNANICYQPATWDNNIHVGFQHPPQGFQFANSSILCYHYYRPPTVVSASSFMKARMSDLKRLKSAGLLSEFYTLNQYDDNSQIMDLCDQYGQSWLGWLYQISANHQYTFKRNSVSILSNSSQSQIVGKVAQKSITRTYAQRIAGQGHKQKFDRNTKKFVLSYYHYASKGETIIYFSKEYHYNNGISFECLPQNQVECIIQEDIYLKVRSNQNGIRVYVTIEAL